MHLSKDVSILIVTQVAAPELLCSATEHRAVCPLPMLPFKYNHFTLPCLLEKVYCQSLLLALKVSISDDWLPHPPGLPRSPAAPPWKLRSSAFSYSIDWETCEEDNPSRDSTTRVISRWLFLNFMMGIS